MKLPPHTPPPSPRRRRSRIAPFALSIALAAALPSALPAHEGPEHEIQELTDRIKLRPDSADLYVQRATEYRVLGKLNEAAQDLERALQLEETPMVSRELGKTYFAMGKTNEALKELNYAIKQDPAPSDRAALLLVRAEVLTPRKEYRKALDDVEEALKLRPDLVEAYLTRSSLQSRLKLKSERIKGLERGMEKTGSGALLPEFVDALIDDEKFETALRLVEKEIAESRWQSSWLLRRAKIRHAQKKDALAKEDLHAALAELKRRIRPDALDASLIAERGLAHDLLGDREDARRDYRQAREKGFHEDWIRDRLRALRKEGDEEEN